MPITQERCNGSPQIILHCSLQTVIDETLTLLRVRGERKRALLLGARFFHDGLAEIHKVTTADLALAWEIFEQFDDKYWSFTDCTSKVVMEQLSIKVAFAFDHHFHHLEQFKLCLNDDLNRRQRAR